MQKPNSTPSVFVKAINSHKQAHDLDRMVGQSAAKFSVEDLTRVYNQARVDYLIPMPMAPRRFEEYVKTNGIDLERSCVMLDTILYDVVGLGLIGLRGKEGWVSRFGVVPLARGLGLGSRMMDRLLTEMGKNGVSRVVLELLKDSAPGFALVQKFGFEPVRELLVARRPPAPQQTPTPVQPDHDVRYLHGQEAAALLRDRHDRPSWLNATESFNAIAPERLGALTWERADGSSGWVVYENARFQLKRVTVGVTQGDPAEVTTQILNTLHGYVPNKDATIEDMPTDDPRWPGYEAAGYFETFRRVELAKQLEA